LGQSSQERFVLMDKIKPKVKNIWKPYMWRRQSSKVIIKLNNSTSVDHLKKGLGSWTKLNPKWKAWKIFDCRLGQLILDNIISYMAS
jgi:hypothetical protein